MPEQWARPQEENATRRSLLGDTPLRCAADFASGTPLTATLPREAREECIRGVSTARKNKISEARQTSSQQKGRIGLKARSSPCHSSLHQQREIEKLAQTQQPRRPSTGPAPARRPAGNTRKVRDDDK